MQILDDQRQRPPPRARQLKAGQMPGTAAHDLRPGRRANRGASSRSQQAANTRRIAGIERTPALPDARPHTLSVFARRPCTPGLRVRKNARSPPWSHPLASGEGSEHPRLAHSGVTCKSTRREACPLTRRIKLFLQPAGLIAPPYEGQVPPRPYGASTGARQVIRTQATYSPPRYRTQSVGQTRCCNPTGTGEQVKWGVLLPFCTILRGKDGSDLLLVEHHGLSRAPTIRLRRWRSSARASLHLLQVRPLRTKSATESRWLTAPRPGR